MAQRPLIATINLRGPFEVLTRPLTLGAFAQGPPAGTPPPGIQDGLLAWWKVDECDGASTADSSGHKREAHLNGPARWCKTAGPLEGAIELDGRANYLACDDAEDLDIGDRMTVAVWFKARPAEKARMDEAKTGALAAKGEAWSLRRYAKDGTLEFGLSGPIVPSKKLNRVQSPSIRSSRMADDGQWHHAVATYNGKQAVLYVDGQEQGSTAASGRISVTTAPLTFGENGASRGQFFDGWLGDVRLYGRSISSDEVRTLWSAGRPPSTAAK